MNKRWSQVHLPGQEALPQVIPTVPHLQHQEAEGLLQDDLQHELGDQVPQQEGTLWRSGGEC